MTSKKDKKPHDALAKKVLENPVAAREFLEEYLPAEFKEYIDIATLKVEKESHVEESLKRRLSDVVYSVSTKNQDKAFIYCLCEHQSSSDHWIALRLWKYSLLLLERHKKKKDKLPLILPLVLYNGKDKYTAPRNIWELFSNSALAKKALVEDHRLIDLQAMSDDDIDYEKHLSFILYTMKHIHDRDCLNMLKNAMKRCYKAILIDKGQDYIHTKLILWYTDSKVPEEKKQLLEQLIVDNLPKEDREDLMRTVADSYIDEGIAIGKNEGIAIGKNEGIAIGEARGVEKTSMKIAKNLLLQNTSLDTISSATGLSIDQLQKLKSST